MTTKIQTAAEFKDRAEGIVARDPQSGYVLRRTIGGWQIEDADRNTIATVANETAAYLYFAAPALLAAGALMVANPRPSTDSPRDFERRYADYSAAWDLLESTIDRACIPANREAKAKDPKSATEVVSCFACGTKFETRPLGDLMREYDRELANDYRRGRR